VICECGHSLTHLSKGRVKIRTKMVLLQKSLEDQWLAVVCPACKQDVVLGILSQPEPDPVLVAT
jgi:hypothetical protein